MLKLFGMTCGWLDVPTAVMFEGEPGRIRVPVPSFLIDHPKGKILFDSGLPTAVQGGRNTDKRETGSAADEVEAHFGEGEDVGARLRSGGIDPEKIDFLINSHLHSDHAGGNNQIPNARWIVQRKEWECGCSDGCHEHFMDPAHYNLGHDRILADGAHDVFGDGSVVCLPTYGHTPGHQSLRVTLESGTVILTADACYTRRTLAKMHLPGIVADREAMLRSLQFLARRRAQGAHLIFGHDPEFWMGPDEGAISPITIAKGTLSRPSAA